MDIIVTCECGQKYRVRVEHAGKTGKCPACGQMLSVPTVSSDVEPATQTPLASTHSKAKSSVSPESVARDSKRNRVSIFVGVVAGIGLVLIVVSSLYYFNVFSLSPDSRHLVSTPSFTPTVAPSFTPRITPSSTPHVTPIVTPTVRPTVTLRATPVTLSFKPSVMPTVTATAKPMVMPRVTPHDTPVVTPVVTHSAMSSGESEDLRPPFQYELEGTNAVRIKNINSFDIAVGLRAEKMGKNFNVPAYNTSTVYVPDGRYDVYLIYANEPHALYQSDPITTNQNGVEIVLGGPGVTTTDIDHAGRIREAQH